MPHIPFTLFFSTLMLALPQPLSALVIAKIITRRRELCRREVLYIVVAGLFVAISTTITLILNEMQYLSIPFVVLTAIAEPIAFFFFFYWLNAYTAKQSLLLSLIIMALSFVLNFVTLVIFSTLFDTVAILSPPPAGQIVLYNVAMLILAALFAILFIKVTGRLREVVHTSKRLQTAAIVVLLIAWLISAIASSISVFSNPEGSFQDNQMATALTMEFFLIVGYTVTMLVSFIFYTRYRSEKAAKQKKEAEQSIWKEYTNQIEQLYNSTRGFRHGYINMITPIFTFTHEKNWGGLEKYIAEVEESSAIILNSNDMLADLSNIKIGVLKGILLTKLLDAQRAKIDVTFEASEEISHNPIGSVPLVKMVGIILDNAIEELKELGDGRLAVACVKGNGGVTFIVRNTCRSDTKPIYQLKESGFSTKGKGRGLGLSNLAEIADAYPDNISLQTEIKGGNFTQKLRIGGAG